MAVVTLLLLGAWHGINPGMGWLFAVALGAAKKVAYRGSSGSFADRAGTCVGHRSDCFPGLFSWLGHSDQVAANRRCGRSYVRCDLEALAGKASDMGWYAGQFLGPDVLVMHHGKRAWRGAHDHSCSPGGYNLVLSSRITGRRDLGRF